MNNPLTPDLTNAFNQITGGKVSTNPSGVPSRGDQIRALAKSVPNSENQPNPVEYVNNAVKSAVDSTTKTLQTTGPDVSKNIKTAFSKDATPGEDNGNFGDNFLGDLSKRLASLGHVAGDVATTALAPVMHLVTALIPSEIRAGADKGVNWVADKITNQPAFLQTLNKINDGLDKNPDLKQALISDLPSALGLLGGSKVNGLNPKLSLGDVKGVGETLLKDVNEGASGFIGKADELGNSSKDLMGVAKSKATDLVKGKTEAEILATPESKLYKLSPNERKVYFDAQQSKIAEQSRLTEEKIKSNLKTQTESAQVEVENLNKELSKASRDEVVALRPKIVKALGEQSATYRQLVDEEISQHADVPITQIELKQFVESKYVDNPELASAIKDRLGLSKDIATPKQGELPTIEAKPEPDTTIGDIYKKTKDLRQDLGSASKKGTRVYSSDEKLTDDAISTLSNFLKSKGVDLSEANKFWSRYAPIRNQLVMEAKPFLQSGTQTKTFANTLTRVAKGVDVNNENFVNEVENLVGEPVAKGQKAILEKLSANEKAQVANEFEAKMKLEENRLTTEQAKSKLDSKQFEIERQAKLRTYAKRVIYAILLGEGFKHLIP